jgi:hypothetical protein
VWACPRLRTDFFAIGSADPLTVDPLALADTLQGAVGEDLKDVGTEDLWRLVGGLLLDEEATRQFGHGSRLNTDEHPLLEFSTPRHLYRTGAKRRAVESAYAAGQRSHLPLTPEAGPAVLELLGLRLSLPPGVAVVRSGLVPHHPRELGIGGALRDVAELRLDVQTPDGPAVLRAAPRPREDWPESLALLWPDPSTRTTGQGGDILLHGEEFEAAASALAPDAVIPLHVEELSEVVRGSVDWPLASVVWEVPASPQARQRLRARARLLVSYYSPTAEVP